MARGDLSTFNEFTESIGDGRIDMDGDTFKVALITTLPVVTQTTPTLADFTEVTGSGYTAGGETIGSVTWTHSAGVTTFDGADVSWTQNGSGPTNIVAALIYSDTSTSDDAVAFVDMTADGGTTPISLQDGDISIAWNASGILTVTRTA